MTTYETIQQILEQRFQPLFLDIRDDSHLHAGHNDEAKNGSTHFHITIVSEAFEELSLIKQHRAINEALAELMDNPIHALAMKTVKASKWQG